MKVKFSSIWRVVLALVLALSLGLMTVVPAMAADTVNLRSAGAFAILSYAGITNVPTSHITGSIGVTPLSGDTIEVTCPEMVSGIIYSVDATGPACRVTNSSLLGTAMGDLGLAVTDANSRATGFLNAGSGHLGGLVLAPGVYTFDGESINVDILTNLTLSGGANDVWIFQIPGTFNVAVDAHVNLDGGAQAANIFWTVAGATTLKTSSVVYGNILCHTSIAMQSGATLYGRALAETESVTLIASTVTMPITEGVPPIPEPSTIILIPAGLGAVALAFVLVNRRTRAARGR